MGDDEIEILDPETYRSGSKGETFSHSQLVMFALKKCIESGSVEMREGYFNRKRDRFGNTVEIYVPDTRLTFIETVESTIMIMADDIESDPTKDESKKEIKKIQEELKKRKETYLKLEEAQWSNASHQVKQMWQKNGKTYVPGVLTEFFPYYNYYIVDKIEAYRKIVAELKKLTLRKDYYREEFFEA